MEPALHKNWKYYLPASAWTCVILVLTLMPAKVVPDIKVLDHIPQFDKLVHAFFFMLFVILWSAALYLHRGPIYHKRVIHYIIAGILLGITIEFLQKDIAFIHRDFEIGDMIADAIGALIGGYISQRYLQEWIKIFLH
ncbi:VanZ family protein [Thermoflavifilum thermophilum]|uniref:VanZ like family protein n=1 Tax=Thermoflavifilum thermophilum TaxID=1393122 RepID=A0A1I7N8I6_9BACT|nr:VanZ family protein [Thermoflavifilum thermophilum]SFV30977.1 VanZ like family protein [Thermoflavifilum thermophilum]